VQLEVVHDLAEASHRNESARAFVLVLEEGLNKKAAQAHFFSETHQQRVQLFFLIAIQNITGVQNGWRHKCRKPLGGDLLQILLCKDVVDLLAEWHIGDEGSVSLIEDAVGLFKQSVLLGGQNDLLGVEHGAEFCWLNDSLAQLVVVLEKFEQPNAIALDNVLHLLHESI